MRYLGLLCVVVVVGCSAASPGAHISGTSEELDASVGEPRPDAAARVDASIVPDARSIDAGFDVGRPSAVVTDAPASDGPASDSPGTDASDACSVSGAPGTCITVTACAALADHTSYAGLCPGPASIECCIVTPSTADNPPTPAGYQLMAQSQVTSAMTAWAVMILDDPTMYPMFSTAMQTFGSQPVLARVEWHPPDFQNSVIHRGVTLYVPT